MSIPDDDEVALIGAGYFQLSETGKKAILNQAEALKAGQERKPAPVTKPDKPAASLP
jgi:hypothetical protein